MCGIGLEDRFLGGELGERLGVDDMALMLLQSGLRWHVLRREDAGWVKGCMECGVGVRNWGGIWGLSGRSVGHLD